MVFNVATVQHFGQRIDTLKKNINTKLINSFFCILSFAKEKENY